MENFKTVIKDMLKLDEMQAKCYEIMFLKGHITVGELCGYFDLDMENEYTRISTICEVFVKEGLAKKVPKAGKLVDIYLPLTPFGALVKYLTQFSEGLELDLKKIQTGIKEIRDTTESKTKDTVNTVKSKLSEGITNLKENTTKSADQRIINVNDEISKKQNEIKEQLKIMNSAITTAITQFQTNETEILTKWHQSQSTAAETQKTQITTTLSQAKTDQIKGTETFSNEENQRVKANQKIQEDSIIEFKTGQESTLTDFSEKAKGSMNEFQDSQGKAAEIWKTDSQTHMTTLQEKSLQSIAEITQNYSTTTQTFKEKAIEQLSTLKQEMEKILDENGVKHLEALIALGISTKTTLTEQINSSKKDFATNLTTHQTTILQKITEYNENITKGFQKSEQDLINAFEASNKELTSTMTQSNQQLDSQLTQNIETEKKISADYLATLTASGETFIETGKTTFKEAVANRASQIQDLLKTASDTTENYKIKVDDAQTVFHEALAKYNSEFSTGLENNLKIIAEQMKNELLQINTNISKEKDAILTWLDEMKASFDSRFSSFKNQLQEKTNIMQKMVTTNIDALQVKLNESVKGLTTNAQNSSNTTENAVKNQNSQFIEQTQTFLTTLRNVCDADQKAFQDLSNQLLEKLQEIRDSYKTANVNSVNGYEARLAQSCTTMKYETTKSLDSTCSKFKTNLDNTLEQFKVEEGQTKENLNSLLQTNTETFNTLTKTTNEKLAHILEDALIQWNKGIDEHQTNWKTSIGSYRKGVISSTDQAINTQTTSITQIITGHLTKLSEFKQTFESSLTEKIKGHMSGIESNNKAFHTALTTNTSNFDKQIATLITQLIQNITQKTVSLTSKIKEFAEQELSGLNLHCTALMSIINTVHDTAIQNVQKTNETFIMTLTTEKEKAINQTNQTMEKSTQTVTTTTETTSKDTETTLIKLNDTVKTDLTTFKTDVSSASTTAQKVVDEQVLTLTETTKYMLDKIDSTTAIVITPIIEIKKVAESRKIFLDAVWNDSFKWELLGFEGSWLLYTKAAIQNFLKSMIERTKMNCFILVPNLSWLPHDAFKKIKKTQKITIACGPNVDKAYADELLKLGENISIRVVTEMNMEVIGAERDREESFVGPVVKKGDDMVVTVTIQDEMIALFSEILSGFWRGRSKKYGPE